MAEIVTRTKVINNRVLLLEQKTQEHTKKIEEINDEVKSVNETLTSFVFSEGES